MERRLLAALAAELEAERPAVLVSVVETKGSAPRHLGASMLLLADGRSRGTVGGGSGEAEALSAARASLAGAPDALLEVDKFGAAVSDAQGICGGLALILIQRLEPGTAAADRVKAALAGGASFLTQDLPAGGSFENPLLSEDRLLICGGGHVGLALARLASQLDFAVTVLDEREEFAEATRFPEGVETIRAAYAEGVRTWAAGPADYAAVMTPDHQHDLECVRELLKARPRYLGFIGSARKTRMLLGALKAEGFDPSSVDALYAPIGLDIGSETPAEIAVSILAELVALRRGALSLAAAATDRLRRRA